MKKNDMLTIEDRLAIALSGGKDSTVLLLVLDALFGKNLFPVQAREGRAPVAITIDEGISGYRAESCEIARKACERVGIKQVVFSFKEMLGLTLDEMVEKAPGVMATVDPATQLKNAKELLAKPCSICGVLRRRILNDVARLVGATKLATGHNLDDEVETFLMNVFKGDLARLGRNASAILEDSNDFVKKIKPLGATYEKDIVLYLYHAGGEFQSTPCPYSRLYPVFRGEVKDLVTTLEYSHPGVRLNVASFIERVSPCLVSRPGNGGGSSRCPECGALKSPGVGTCMTCFYVENFCEKNYNEVLSEFSGKYLEGL